MSVLDCSSLDDRLLDYLYDELPDGERADFEQHVAGCSRCAAEVAAFRRVRQAARALPIEEPSPQVTTRLLEAAAGRNVVPLPLPQKPLQVAAAAAETAAAEQASDEAEPSAAATDFIMAAARARVAAAPAAAAPIAASGATAGAGGPVPITAARKARRWVSHPAFAMAAGLVVVTLGTAYFFTENHKAAEQSSSGEVAMARPPKSPEAAPAAATSPAAADDPAPAAEPDTVERVVPMEPSARPGPGALLAKDEHAAAPAPATITPLPTTKPAPPAGFAEGSGHVGRVAGGEASGGGSGYGTGVLAHARTGQQAVGQPSPPKGRNLGNGAVNLAPEEKETLERSVVTVMDQSAKKRDAVKEKAASQQEEVALAESPRAGSQGGKAWAPPPPPPVVATPAPAPVAAAPATTRSAGPQRGDADDRAAPAQEQANNRSRTQVKAPPIVVFQELVRSNRCTSELFEAYQKVKASDSGYAVSANERLYVAHCYGNAGLYDVARAECEALRVQYPELAQRIDAELVKVSDGERKQQLAQRRAAEAAEAAPAAPKAKATRAKAGKAAADAATSY